MVCDVVCVPWRARDRVGGYRPGFLSCFFLLRHLFFFSLLDEEKERKSSLHYYSIHTVNYILSSISVKTLCLSLYFVV